MKLCLKSLQEFVRLQTFNRSGFQQIQLDIQFLRNPLKEIVEDEAAIDFLMDEVIKLLFSSTCFTSLALYSYDAWIRQGHAMDMARTRILHIKSEVSDMIRHVIAL